jgi:ABC-type multidrug transport system fused ATPase/permease subunit
MRKFKAPKPSTILQFFRRLWFNGVEASRFFRDAAKNSPSLTTGLLGVNLLSMALEGANVALLAPLLRQAGVGDAGGPEGRVTAAVETALEWMGLDGSLPWLLAAFLAATAAQAAAQYANALLSVKLEQSHTRGLQRRMFRAVAESSWLAASRKRGSDVSHLFTSEAPRVGHGARDLVQSANGAAMLAVYLGAAFYLSWKITLLTAAGAIVVFALVLPFVKLSYGGGSEIHRLVKAFFSRVEEQFRGLKVAKIYGAEAYHLERFTRLVARLQLETERLARASAASAATYRIGGAVLLAAFFYYAVAIYGVSTGSLFLLVYLFARLLPRFNNLSQIAVRTAGLLPAYRATNEFVAEIEKRKETPATSAERARFRESLELRDVGFSYREETGERQLDGVSFALPFGRVAAAVGPSGSGKSTLADVMAGLLDPQSGEILVDGVPLTPENKAAWRRSISYVPQEPFLFFDSVRENLAWAHPEADEEAMRRALALGGVLDVVERLPRGLNEPIGEEGASLSGGERRRIALARGLLRDPDLLILDEATVSMDFESERRVAETLERLRGATTVLIIAHQLNAIRSADYILEMDRGRVVAAGDKRDVLSREGGFFNRMTREA